MDQLGQWLWFSIDFIFVLSIKVNPHLMLGWLTPIYLVMHALKTKAFFG